MEEGYTEPTLDSLGGASLYIPSFTPRRALFHLMMDSLSSSMPWTHPRTEQPCLCPLGPQGPHSPPHVPGGCYGPSPQVRKPQGPGRRGQAGSGQASLVPEAWSWHLTVWGPEAASSWVTGCWEDAGQPGPHHVWTRRGRGSTRQGHIWLPFFMEGPVSKPPACLLILPGSTAQS